MHTDYYFSMFTDPKCPAEPDELYINNNSAQIKEIKQGRLTADTLPKETEVVKLEDNDEDDYETMKPGVSTNNLLPWTEMRRGSKLKERSIPRPYSLKPRLNDRVNYTSIALEQGTYDRLSLRSTSPTSTTSVTITSSTAANTDRTQQVHENNRGGNKKAGAMERTLILLEEEKQSIMPTKWAKPQNSESRRNSTQLNCNWPVSFAKMTITML